MGHNTEEARNTGSFRVVGGRLMLFRVGPANGQAQRHNSAPRDAVTGERVEWPEDRGEYRDYGRIAPASRGFWAFPYPFHDAYFYHHVWMRHLPKNLRSGSCPEDSVQSNIWWGEHSKALKRIRRTFRPRIIMHEGPFWSHIRPDTAGPDKVWYQYDNAREWVQKARKSLWRWNPGDNNMPPWKIDYSVDHLEIFVAC